MRIVAGQYRGRRFDVPHTFRARPTTDFAKENLFNVLRAYIDFDDEAPTALDLFAGTGSITLELLSRGCASVTAVEMDRQHARLIERFVTQLGAAQQATVLRADVLKLLRPRPDATVASMLTAAPFGFVFADPPYALPELPLLPELVIGAEGLMAPGALFVLEHGETNDFSANPHFLTHRNYGSVHFSIFRPAPES